MRKLLIPSIALGAAFGLMLVPGRAAAQECSADVPCPEGFTCETGMYEACPAIAIDCPPDAMDCEQPACTPEEYSYCTPNPCDPDGAADQCGPNMVCYTYEGMSCSGGTPACEPGADCPMVEPVEMCETYSESYCTYKYSLPCEAAADCGDGFTCETETYEVGCACPGSAGGSMGSPDGTEPAPAPAEGDPITPPPAEECVCETSTETYTYCQVIEVPCETDAECAEGWTCQEIGGSSVGCATVDSSEPASAPVPSMGGATPEGEAKAVPPASDPAAQDDGAAAPAPPPDECMTMEPAMVVKQCMPPGFYYFAAGDAVATNDSGGVTLGGAEGMASGAPLAPNDPRTQEEGAPSIGDDGDVMTNAANGNSSSSDSAGACSFTGGPASSSGFAGLLLGLAALVVRRRR